MRRSLIAEVDLGSTGVPRPEDAATDGASLLGLDDIVLTRAVVDDDRIVFVRELDGQARAWVTVQRTRPGGWVSAGGEACESDGQR